MDKNLAYQFFVEGFGTPNCVGRDQKEFDEKFDKLFDRLNNKGKELRKKPVLESICNLFSVDYSEAERVYNASHSFDEVYEWASKTNQFQIGPWGNGKRVFNKDIEIYIKSADSNPKSLPERVKENNLIAERILTMLNHG